MWCLEIFQNIPEGTYFSSLLIVGLMKFVSQMVLYTYREILGDYFFCSFSQLIQCRLNVSMNHCFWTVCLPLDSMWPSPVHDYIEKLFLLFEISFFLKWETLFLKGVGQHFQPSFEFWNSQKSKRNHVFFFNFITW